MSVLRIASRPYDSPDILRYLIHGYVFPDSVLYGGLSVDPDHAADQMLLVKELWHQTEGRQLRHFILCLDAKESSDVPRPGALWVGACAICEYFAAEYQIVFGIQRKYGRWHIHFVMNNVSFVTGKRFPEKNTHDYQLAKYIPALPIYTNLVDVVYN